jgi:HEAT repeat protein
MRAASENAADLLEDLDSPDKPTVRAAVDALIPLAADSPKLRETLSQVLTDPRRRNHWSVAYVLAHLPQPSPDVKQILLAGLDHREPDIRWAIALLLVRMARAQGDLVHLLIKLCLAGTPTQKRMTIYCLRDLNLTDAKSLQALLESLRDSDPLVRVAATTSLKSRTEMDDSGREALLHVFLNDSEVKVRNAAALTLAGLGSPSQEFLSALSEAAEDQNPQIRKAASAALALLQNKRSAPTGS